MKAIGTVFLDFGIATVPLGVYSAVREHAIKFKSVCLCGGTIRQKRFCEAEDKEVSYEELQKEYEGIIFGKEEVKLSTENKVEILLVAQKDRLSFVIPKQKPYLCNVVKDKKRGSQSKLYQAFVDWLVENDCYAIGRFSVRTKENLVLIVPDTENYNITITPIYYGDEVIQIEDSQFIKQEVSEKERELSQQFFTRFYSNSEKLKEKVMSFNDEQNEKLIKIIEAKSRGETIVINKIKEVKETEDLTKLFEKSV